MEGGIDVGREGRSWLWGGGVVVLLGKEERSLKEGTGSLGVRRFWWKSGDGLMGVGGMGVRRVGGRGHDTAGGRGWGCHGGNRAGERVKREKPCKASGRGAQEAVPGLTGRGLAEGGGQSARRKG